MSNTTTMELEEGEREILFSALEVLSPDSPEATERLETFTQTVLDATLESGALEMTFDSEQLEFAISALDVVSPEEFEMQDLADALCERMRAEHAGLTSETPEL